MKTLFESLRGRYMTHTSIDKGPFSCNDIFSARDKYIALVDKYKDDFKKDAVEAFGEWMKENPTKRNVTAQAELNVGINIYSQDKLFLDIIKEMSRIGVIDNEFEDRRYFDKNELYLGATRYSLKYVLSCPTYKQFRDGNYKAEDRIYDEPMVFSKSRYGNGYNDFPADDMTILRQKLYDCIKGVDFEVYKSIYNTPDKNRPSLPKYSIVLTAQYDKSKLKKLWQEITNDKRLQNYADRHEAIGRGIAAYYASKGPGEYVGD